MSLPCPRCRAVQPPENRHCTKCGSSLPAPPEAAVFRFAEPMLVAEAAPLADTERVETEDFGPGLEPAAAQLATREARLPLVKPFVFPDAVTSSARHLPETVGPTVRLSEENLPKFSLPELPKPDERLEELPQETPPAAEKVSDPWKLPVWSALVGLFVLLAAFAGAGWIISAAKRTATSRPALLSASLPAVPSPNARPASAVLPLTLQLQSAAAGRHVTVGSQVAITAFATLGPGQSAALALSCRPAQGRKTMFSFAEGRLCSANWTPSAPGRYIFTATALDEQGHTASARPLSLYVDGPASRAVEAFVPVLASPVVKVSRSLSERRVRSAVVRATGRPKKRRSAFLRTAVPAFAPPVAAAPARPAAYHVVAASFPFPGNAEILARALRARGLPAVTGRRHTKRGKVAYVVEVGSFRLPAEAHQKTLALQRSGYPAYIQRR